VERPAHQMHKCERAQLDLKVRFKCSKWRKFKGAKKGEGSQCTNEWTSTHGVMVLLWRRERLGDLYKINFKILLFWQYCRSDRSLGHFIPYADEMERVAD
jgi:hypothetical protein